MCAAANVQTYIRFEIVARLHRLGVEVLPWMRLYGADGRTAYFVHTASREAVVLEDVDTLVLSTPNHPCDELVAVSDSDGNRASSDWRLPDAPNGRGGGL